MTERITYTDPATHQHDDVDIPDELLNDQEIEWVRDALGPSDLRRRWALFLGQAGARAMVDAEIQRRQILQTQPQPFHGGQHYGNYQMIRVETQMPDGSTRRVDMNRVAFEMGPRDALGNYDDAFGALDDATKMQRWETHIASNDVHTDVPIYSTHLGDLLDQLEVHNSEPADRACDCLRSVPGFRSWGKTKVFGIFAVAGGLAVGIWQLVEYLQAQAAGSAPIPPGPATDVKAAAAWRTGGKSTVTVNWTSGSPVAATWSVSLVAAGGMPITAIVAGSLTSAMFSDVPDGNYMVTVVGFNGTATSAAAMAEVKVADPGPVNPATGKPPKPTNVVLAAVSTPLGRFVTATWTAGTGAAATDTFVVTLSAVPQSKDTDIVRDAGTMTSLMLSPSTDGPYVAKVKARRGNQDSDEATSNQVSYVRVDPNAPNPPAAVKISAYRNATGQPGLVVRWDPPAGDPPRDYTVTFQPPGGVKATTVTSPSTIVGFPNLGDGTYSASVVTNSATASSTAATVQFTLAAASVPADTIDWDDVLSGKVVDDWKAVSTTMDSTQEVQFWADVIAALTDSANNYGGTASFAEQRALARFLSAVITDPADNTNTANQLDTLAGRLANEGQTGANRFPQTPGTAWTGDPLVLWKRASMIRTQGTGAFLPTRRRVQAVAVALDKFLGT